MDSGAFRPGLRQALYVATLAARMRRLPGIANAIVSIDATCICIQTQRNPKLR